MSNASGIESVAVVGAGLMGSGIAECVAVAGTGVVLRDVDEVSIGRARGRIESSLARAVAGGKLDAAAAGLARERIELTTDLEAIAGADLVIEAVPESRELKLEVMEAIGHAAGNDCVIASNTSSIPIAELAQAVADSRARARTAFLLPRAGYGAGRGRRRARHEREHPARGPRRLSRRSASARSRRRIGQASSSTCCSSRI